MIIGIRSTEKRARVNTHVGRVETEAEARARIEEMKKKYYDARHNCWCYIIKDGAVRYSDDGEPQGTAGLPMLEVFKREGVENVVCGVTRYFGGVLLGAGYGALSQAVYVLIGLVGVPIFALGGGFSYIFQPTFGFLLGLIPSALIIGLLTKKSRKPVRIVLSCVAGLAALYAVGLPYMALILNVYMDKGLDFWAVLKSGMLPFLPGDALKIAVAAVLFPKLSVLFDKKR